MDIIAWFFIISIIGGFLLIYVDKIIFLLKPYREENRVEVEHLGLVLHKKYTSEKIYQVKPLLYYVRSTSLLYHIPEGFDYVSSKYEVEIVLDQEFKKIFDKKELFDSVEIGEELIMTFDRIVCSKKSLFEKDMTTFLKLKSWKKRELALKEE